MSLESALAEEARDVVAILEGRSLKQTQRVRAASPAGMAQSPVRSMLDIGNTSSPKARHASVAGAAVGVTKPGSPFSQHEPIRSMLDTTTPPRPPTSPPITLARASSKSPPPPAVRQIKPSKFDPESAYQFDILPSSDRNALPKRVTQGGKKTKGAMASVFASSDDVRRGSFLGGANASRSPGPRLPAGRSESPATRKLNTNSMNLMTGPGKFVVSDSGHLIDMTNAYRRLSDVALLKSGGSLSQLPARKDYNKDTGEQITPDGGVRLAKDYQNPTEDEDAIETSDEENSSSDELGEDHRGRGRTRKGSNEAVEDDEAAEKRKPKSLLAAAEQERMRPPFSQAPSSNPTNLDPRQRHSSLLQVQIPPRSPSTSDRPRWRKAVEQPQQSHPPHNILRCVWCLRHLDALRLRSRRVTRRYPARSENENRALPHSQHTFGPSLHPPNHPR